MPLGGHLSKKKERKKMSLEAKKELLTQEAILSVKVVLGGLLACCPRLKHLAASIPLVWKEIAFSFLPEHP